MLYAGLDKQKRKKLSRNTGIPFEGVLELVKLSDQARIFSGYLAHGDAFCFYTYVGTSHNSSKRKILL
jgi:hypothetical protein